MEGKGREREGGGREREGGEGRGRGERGGERERGRGEREKGGRLVLCLHGCKHNHPHYYFIVVTY